MRLKSNVTPIEFLNTVQKCRGEVYLNTNGGDELNLKSAICQYLFIAICTNTKLSTLSTFHCQYKEDQELLSALLEM